MTSGARQVRDYASQVLNSTTEGVYWLEHTSAAAWGGREGSVAVISNDTVLVIAGRNWTNDTDAFNDVWQSTGESLAHVRFADVCGQLIT